MPHTPIPKTKPDSIQQFGYYEFLPTAYQKGSGKKWPMIVYLHGAGQQQVGGSSVTQLSKLLATGLPRVIDSGRFPGAEDFLVMSPQNWGYFTPAFVHNFTKQLIGLYDVDPDQIHLTGYSYGSFAIKDYLRVYHKESQFATFLPIAGNGIYESEACLYDSLPIWFFHGAKDTNRPTNPLMSISAYNKLNACPGRKEKAKLTLYVNGTHGGITHMAPYDGSVQIVDSLYNPHESIYPWMLAHRRPGAIVQPAPNPLSDESIDQFFGVPFATFLPEEKVSFRNLVREFVSSLKA